jgi:aryl-alcohol dehydrogenase-like predicted oxidoreductase
VLSHDGDARCIRQSVEQSLNALRTDYLDLVQIHCLHDEVEPHPRALDALRVLQREGKVRFLGASVYGEAAGLAAISAGVDCLQIALSAIDRRPLRRVLPAAEAASLGIVVRSALLKGALSDRRRALSEWFAPLQTAIRRLEELSAQEVADLPELAYRYVLSEPRVHTVLAGTRHVWELNAAAESARRGPLPARLLESINGCDMAPEDRLNPALWPPTP